MSRGRSLFIGPMLGLLLAAGSALAQPIPNCVSSAVAGGTSDAIVIPQLPCTATSTLLILTASAANTTTTPTLQIIGTSPIPIVKGTGIPLAAGDIAGAGFKAVLVNSGSAWTLTNPIGGSSPGGGNVVGPSGATAPDIAVFSGSTGLVLADSGTTVAELAPLASPTFTGIPAAPTAAYGTSTTQLATTAFVESAMVNDNYWVSVKSSPCNAVGDGVTDDTLAIRDCVDIANGIGTGALLYFPAGTYRVQPGEVGTIFTSVFGPAAYLRGINANAYPLMTINYCTPAPSISNDPGGETLDFGGFADYALSSASPPVPGNNIGLMVLCGASANIRVRKAVSLAIGVDIDISGSNAYQFGTSNVWLTAQGDGIGLQLNACQSSCSGAQGFDVDKFDLQGSYNETQQIVLLNGTPTGQGTSAGITNGVFFFTDLEVGSGNGVRATGQTYGNSFYIYTTRGPSGSATLASTDSEAGPNNWYLPSLPFVAADYGFQTPQIETDIHSMSGPFITFGSGGGTLSILANFGMTATRLSAGVYQISFTLSNTTDGNYGIKCTAGVNALSMASPNVYSIGVSGFIVDNTQVDGTVQDANYMHCEINDAN